MYEEHDKFVRVYWGPSSSEGPQKHDLTVFSKCNT
jgi:hypothetical protein